MLSKISITDVARQLNISKTTVSFILNGKAAEKKIHDDLVIKVLKFVGESGYKANTFAKSLRTGKSYTIALLVEDISDPFCAAVARLIEDRAHQHGYTICYGSTQNDARKAKFLIEYMRDTQVDGYLLSTFPGVEEGLEELLKDNLPVVTFGSNPTDLDALGNHIITNLLHKMVC